MTRQTIVIALGGNAISTRSSDTIYDEFANTRSSLRALEPVFSSGRQVVITHGNGPQVGKQLRRVELALKEVPEVNAEIDGTDIVYKNFVHMGIAAGTPQGLVVPVIRDADQKDLFTIARELGVLSEKARSGKLTAGEMQGGTFTISSLGGIGGTYFSPIVNAPEVAILGVGRASIKPVWAKDKFVPRMVLPLSLAYDHRVIDGATGARFSTFLVSLLGDVDRLLAD